MTAIYPRIRQREKKQYLVSEAFGYKYPDGPEYGTCLPGAIMPFLYDLPQSWLAPGQAQIPKYVLEECYRLSDDSYRFHDGRGNLCWMDHARNGQHFELQAPPATPGFWEILHLETNLHKCPNGYGPKQLRRMLVNIRRYLMQRPDSDERVSALEMTLRSLLPEYALTTD